MRYKFVCVSLAMMSLPGIMGLGGCKKFLNKVPDINKAGPETVADFRSMLDDNSLFVNSTPGLGILATDDLNVDYTTWSRENMVSQGAYVWDPVIYQQGFISASWANPYAAINVCNQVLDGMDKLKIVDNPTRMEFNAVYGTALFYRAFFYYHLEETYGQPYKPGVATSLSGVPLRLTTDALQKAGRSTVEGVYSQILKDLTKCLSYLPAGVQPHHNRPGLPAALALLARVYLARQDYSNALYWSDSCLRTYDTLLDYNTVKKNSRPFPDDTNPEIIFQCSANDYLAYYSGSILADSALYDSYDTNDLRKTLFFQKTPSGKGVIFKGNYTGGLYFFSGIAVDEVLLIRAESNAQIGAVAEALDDLDRLRFHRWKTGTFYPLSAPTADSVLRLVLQEKRKETLFRELRWFDLRRLNQDSRFAHTLKRTLGSIEYTLPPNDLRYTFLIPASEIELSGIDQNPTP